MPNPRRPEAVRVLVDDVGDLEDRVRRVAVLDLGKGVVLELVQPPLEDLDHALRSAVMRLMDRALDAARRAAPGADIRIVRSDKPPEAPRLPLPVRAD